MSQIKSLKLISGEEVVGEVVQENTFIAGNSSAGSITLRRPHTLQFQHIPGGQLALALIPWTLSNPNADGIEISLSHVISQFTPALNVEKQYLEQTSGIALAGLA